MELYTLRGVAAVKGCHPRTVRRAVLSGQLRATRVPGSRQFLILKADADAWTPAEKGSGLVRWNEEQQGRVRL